MGLVDDLVAPVRLAAAAARNGVSRSRAAGNGGEDVAQFFFGCNDGIGYLEKANLTQRDLVYCDPPYLPSTQQSTSLYTFEMSEADHRRLLKAVSRLQCMVMISGYWSEIYQHALKGWRTISFQGQTRGGPSREWLWLNFPPALELHDYRYLGNDRREREHLKRKKLRWTARLARMDVLERQALLAAIGETAIPR